MNPESDLARQPPVPPSSASSPPIPPAAPPEAQAEDAAPGTEGHAAAGLCLVRAALAATANAVLITDRTGWIIWVNQAFSRLTGNSRAEALPGALADSAQTQPLLMNLGTNAWQAIRDHPGTLRRAPDPVGLIRT